jgi:hypothetical protein
VLRRGAAAQQAWQRVAALREQVAAEHALLAQAHTRIQECKSGVLERAPRLLGAATTLAGARKRLQVSRTLSPPRGHVHQGEELLTWRLKSNIERLQSARPPFDAGCPYV